MMNQPFPCAKCGKLSRERYCTDCSMVPVKTSVSITYGDLTIPLVPGSKIHVQITQKKVSLHPSFVWRHSHLRTGNAAG
ncbi:hypothetical protein HNQ65_002716 [Prosthecobacter vanneervenii]|uniref:Uncharacterized protein n=1 Tax=Prosthecobacter vanneervenii TaxID=48466 RepID=A0A7W7YBI5_9BACT|nr:hypothetical protein [Prosthecobacter vanneervenii]